MVYHPAVGVFFNVLNWIGTGVILSGVTGPILVAVTQKKIHKLSAVIATLCGIAAYLVVYVGKLIPSVYLSVAIGCVVSLIFAFVTNKIFINCDAKNAVQMDL